MFLPYYRSTTGSHARTGNRREKRIKDDPAQVGELRRGARRTKEGWDRFQVDDWRDDGCVKHDRVSAMVGWFVGWLVSLVPGSKWVILDRGVGQSLCRDCIVQHRGVTVQDKPSISTQGCACGHSPSVYLPALKGLGLGLRKVVRSQARPGLG
jgi:hypothetical protein